MEPVNIIKTWAKSLLSRIGWVKRKGTKAARKVPANPEEIKEDFLKRVATKVTEHSIPPSMVVNFDETGVNVVPTLNWTLHAQGSKHVPRTGIDDKRQIIMVLVNTPCGKLLPPQLIYQVKTDKVHVVFNFQRLSISPMLPTIGAQNRPTWTLLIISWFHTLRNNAEF